MCVWSFGRVKIGTHIKTGEHVALKIIDKHADPNMIVRNLLPEIRALSVLRHPHVVRLLFVDLCGKYPRKWGGTREVVVLGFEAASGGTIGGWLSFMVEIVVGTGTRSC